MKQSKITYILAFLSVFAWGTMAPLSKVLLAELTNMEVLGYGSLIGTVTLLVALLVTKEYRRMKEYNLRDIAKLIILGFIGYFFYSALYYKGLSILPSQIACILNYLWPIFAIVFSAVILKEKLNTSSIIAILSSFIGVVVIVFKPGAPFSKEALIGSILCIVAAALYGLFNILNKKIGKSQTINMLVYIGCGAVGGILFCNPAEITNFTASQIGGLIWLGIVIDAGGFLLWALALQRGNTAKISNLAYATPVISLLISVIFLHEPISLYSIIGTVLILGGLIYQIKGNE